MSCDAVAVAVAVAVDVAGSGSGSGSGDYQSDVRQADGRNIEGAALC